MPTITYETGHLHYTDEGKGSQTLLLVHGFCESLRMWDDWYSPLKKGDWRIVRVDLPGFGNSNCRAESIDGQAAAIGVLVSELELEEVVLIGHSMGGYAALALAEQEPDWLRGIGLFHSHPYADEEPTRASRNKSVEFIEQNGHHHFLKQLVPKFFAPGRDASYAHQRDRLILWAGRGSVQGIIDAQLAMRDRPDRSEVLAKTELPVLFINGAHDQTVSEARRRRQLALPCRAQLCYLPKAGHLGTVEAPRITQRAVRAFMRFCREFED